MTSSWHGADAPGAVPTSDFASEALWRLPAPCAIFDQVARAVFTNRAFRDTAATASLLDERGRPRDPKVHRAIEEVSRGKSPTLVTVNAEQSGRAVQVEVFGLRAHRGWSALLARIPAPVEEGNTLPSPRLLLHELKAPLLGLHEALATVTQATDGGDGELRAAVARLSRAFARLQGVIDAVQDLVASTTPGTEADWGSVALTPILEDLGEVYSALAASQGHRLEIAVAPDLDPVRGDPTLLARLFGNLVDNAVKFTPPPGRIDVRAEVRGSLVVVEVQDSGPGIPPDQRERIFEPFVRLERDGVLPRPAGSGLGLAVARRLARVHGASLTVADGAVGGTVFRVAFLIRPVAAKSPPARWWGTR